VAWDKREKEYRSLQDSGNPDSLSFHYPDLLLGQIIKLIHQPVDLAVCLVNLTLEAVFFVRHAGGGQVFVQLQHALHQPGHAVVVVGAFVIGVLNNGMSIMGLGIDWQQVIIGLVLLAAVFFDVYGKNKN
jgi:hypothetical protein